MGRASLLPPGAHPISVLDLFSGAGGLSAGFHLGSNRYANVRAVEHDLCAAATYAQNFGDVVYSGDVRHWLREEEPPKVDLVIGGPPCQGFSLIGRRDPNDERNQLWRQFVEAVERAQPRAFVVENVPGFLTSQEFAAFEQAFQEGPLRRFKLEAAVLNAADFGAPQVRRRAIVIGMDRDLMHPGLPTPTADEHVTVRQAFAGIRPFAGARALPPGRSLFRGKWLPGPFKSSELHFSPSYSDLSMDRYRAIPYGGSRVDLPDGLSMDCWRRNPHSATDVMGRLEWDRPSVTIRTEFFKPEKGRFLHPTQHRAITHFEAARLQGFPDDFHFIGDKSSIAKQIGNAVPVPLAEAVGRHLASTLST